MSVARRLPNAFLQLQKAGGLLFDLHPLLTDLRLLLIDLPLLLIDLPLQIISHLPKICNALDQLSGSIAGLPFCQTHAAL